jgi:hypothetical protein
MSFLRRIATVSLVTAALALGTAAVAPAALASGWPGGGHHSQEPPLMFGPVEIPRDGAVSGGFSWSMH